MNATIKKSKWIPLVIMFVVLISQLFSPLTNLFSSEAEAAPIVYGGSISYAGHMVGDFKVNGIQAFCLDHKKVSPTGTTGKEGVYDDPRVRAALYYGYGGPESIFGGRSRAEAIVTTTLVLNQLLNGDSSFNGLPLASQLMSLANAGMVNRTSMSFSPQRVTTYAWNGVQATDWITFNADPRNYVDVNLPSWAKLHSSNGKTYTGTARIWGGEKVWLEAPVNVGSFRYDTGWLTGSIPDFQPIVFAPKSSNYQRLGQGIWIEDPAKQTFFTVDFGPRYGWINIFKKDDKSGAGIAGAKFNIINSNGQVVDTLTTDSGGHTSDISAKWLLPGTYTVREISVPAPYVVPKNPDVKVTVLPNIITPVPITISNARAQGKISITKKDSITGTTLGAGFMFDVYDAANKRVATITTGSNGVATTGDLPLGTYKLIETKAVAPYVVDKTPVTVALLYKNQATPVVVASAVKNNVKAQGKITITKKDRNTGATLGAGFEFDVKNAAGKVVAHVKTDSKGVATTGVLPLGNYTIVETKAVAPYILDKTPSTVTIAYKDQNTAVVVAGAVKTDVKAQGKITITKKDRNTGAILGAGFEFDVKNSAGKIVAHVKTDSKGVATTGVLPLGNYTIVETKAVAPYILDKAPVAVTIAYKDQNTAVVVAGAVKTDVKAQGKITITKKDRNTGVILGAGFEFDVKNTAGKVVAHLVTNSNGTATTGILPLGNYTIVETKAVAPYLLDKAPVAVTIAYKDQNTAVVVAGAVKTDVKAQGKITITKKDRNTGAILGAGFEFDVKNAAGKIVAHLKTDSKGTATTGVLPLGNYTIVETKAVAPYVLDKAPVAVTIAYKDQNTAVVVAGAVKTDVKAQGKITITKKDHDTGAILGEGFEFDVKNSAGKVVAHVKTDSKGIATTGVLPLGNYTIVETKAVAPYLLDQSPVSVTIAYKDQNTAVVVAGAVKENVQAEGQITILKTDEETGKPLQNAEFDIINEAGQVVDHVKTDAAGKAISKRLPLGNYQVKEVVVPTGYTSSNQAFAVTIAYIDQLTELVSQSLEVENTPTEVLLTKKDTENHVIKNAVIELFKATGELVSTHTTDAEGQIRIERLPLGAYYFKEKSAPLGWLVNPDKLHFEITNDLGIVALTMIDEIAPGSVHLKKTDTGNAIVPGAKIEMYTEDGKLYAEAYETDENGGITVTNVPDGKYYFLEKEAPAGWLLNPEKLWFEVVAGKMVQCVMIDEIAIYDAALKKWVAKVNNMSYEEPTGNVVAPLVKKGDLVTFAIKVFNQSNTNTIVAEITDHLPEGYEFVASENPDWKLTGTVLTTDKLKGTILAPGQTAELKLVVHVSQKATATNLVNIAEISKFTDDKGNKVTDKDSTPDRDRDNDKTPKDNVVSEDGTGTNDEDDHDPAEVQLEKGRFEVHKVDRVTGHPVRATFNLLAGEKIIKTFTTEANGVYVSDWLPLGSYTLHEVSTQPGYVIHNPNTTVTLTDNVTKIVNISNDPKVYDAALKKWISNINGIVELPEPVESEVVEKPLVKKGDVVTFTFKIINQCDWSVKTPEITDYLPEGYTFLPDRNPNWTQDEDGKLVYTGLETTVLSPAGSLNNTAEAKLVVQVSAKATADNLLNTAEISKFTDETDRPIIDVDSTPDNVVDNDGAIKDNTTCENGIDGMDQDDHDIADAKLIPSGSVHLKKTDTGNAIVPGAKIEMYTKDGKLYAEAYETDENGGITVADVPDGKYYFLEKEAPAGWLLNPEKLWFEVVAGKMTECVMIDEIAVYDAALRKWVSKVNDTSYEEPTGNVATPVVSIGDLVTFTIKVFNQSNTNAIVAEITDYLPEGFEFIASENPDWQLNGSVLTSNKLKGLVLAPGETAELKLVVQVGKNATSANLINTAEISKFTDDKDRPVIDKDSTPDGDRENDGSPKDNVVNEDGKGKNDQDDHDIALVKLAEKVAPKAIAPAPEKPQIVVTGDNTIDPMNLAVAAALALHVLLGVVSKRRKSE